MRLTKQKFIALAFIIATLAYIFAPANTQPGIYNATLLLPNPNDSTKTEELRFSFILSEDMESSAWTTIIQEFNGFNVTVMFKDTYLLKPGYNVEIRVNLIWQNGTAIQISPNALRISIQNNESHLEIRPSRVDGTTYIFIYRPLVKSNEAFAILFLIAILWFTEAIPLAAAALLVPVLAVIFSIIDAKTALAPFFHPVVALIVGGLLLGRALQRHEIDKRIALLILSKTGSGKPILVLIIMFTTAFLSFWISNTASAAIMIPIGLAIISKTSMKNEDTNYSKVIILGIAYAATIGGIATLIGTTPNPIAAGMIQELLGISFSFIDWLPFGLPYVIIFIPIAWKILTTVFKPEKELEKEISAIAEISKEELEKLGPMARQQKEVLLVFLGTIILWFTEKIPDFAANVIGFRGHGISSGVVALIGASMLFLLGLLEEKDIRRVNWSAVLIIGGGIVLGDVLVKSGVSDWIAQQLGTLAWIPLLLLNFFIGALSLVITMFASNTAAASILVPIAIPLAVTLGVDPILLTITIAIAASLDFALPVGTPPSTLAYSTGRIRLKEMLRVGLILDIVSLLLLTFGIIWIWALLGLVSL